LSAVEVTLVVAALLAGLTGTWSPCGYSMLETIGPTGHSGGRRTTLAACVAFVPGALAGGALTFGILGWAGGLLHGSGQIAYVAAAAIAGVAAIADIRGMPIVPQIRRQLPEHWRRVMPMPLAAALYGVLLGLGFTTFVLSFGVWALAAISFALGDPWLGIATGVAFGAGRAIPIVALAPLVGSPLGGRAISAMAERPSIYRGFRLGDGLALAAAAATIGLAGPAASASTVAGDAGDPGAAGTDLVFQRSDRSGIFRSGAASYQLLGSDPAIGGPYIAVRNGDEVDLYTRGNPPTPVVGGQNIATPGANAIAVSASWLVWRAHEGNDDKLRARRISDISNIGSAKLLTTVSEPSRLSHPSIFEGTLVYARAQRRSNQLVRQSISSGHSSTLAKSTSQALQNPSIYGSKLLYVVLGRKQSLVLRKLSGGRSKALYTRSRSGPRLDTTALGSKYGYVTLLSGNADPPSQTLLKFRR
jgi:MFS family permease